MTLRACLLAASSLLLVLVSAGPPAMAVDAKPLVGEWDGRWTTTAGSSDNVQIVVEGATGTRAWGVLFMTVVIPGQAYYNRDVPFEGAFDGTVLTFSVPPGLWFSLTVTGERMRGSVQGLQTFGRVELERKR